MKNNLNNAKISHINEILFKQKQQLTKNNIFQDQAQNQLLHNRINKIKNNYQYIHKIDKASHLIKNAKKSGQYMIQRNRQQINKKYRLKDDQSNHKQSRYVDNNDNQSNKKQQNNSFMNPENQTDEQLNKSLQTNMKIIDHEQSYQKPKSNQKNPSTKKNDTIINQIDSEYNRTQNISIQDKYKSDKYKSNKYKQDLYKQDNYIKDNIPKQRQQGLINKSLTHIQVDIVKKYFQDKVKNINSQTQPDFIYKIINPFYQLCGIKITVPLIKKYKNCLFFGDSKDKNNINKYQGFIFFYLQNKIYYGEMKMQKKHGFGVQIDFNNDVVYKGTFQRGRKTGKFQVIKSDQKYIGMLNKGKYHGQGQLQTKFSVYKGYFENGQRHGQGQQKFTIMNLTLTGNFMNNKFSNKNEIMQTHRLSTITNKSQQNYNKTQKIPKIQSKMVQNSIISDKVDKIVDKTVSYQISPLKKQLYQQFNCAYGQEEQEYIDDIEVVKLNKLPTFRIKQNIKQSPFSKQKRTISQQKSYKNHNH